jgi:superfamily II DNA or RNA helicase/HKD family nuclease
MIKSRRMVWPEGGLMEEGLYESLVTARLHHLVEDARSHGLQTLLADVDEADQPYVLARHIAGAAEHALAAIPHVDRAHVVNEVLAYLDAARDNDWVVAQPQFLLAVLAPGTSVGRPATPLRDAALLTNTHGEPNLGAELRAELDSADEVDLLCAFVKWHGIRVLESQLARLRGRRVPLRVITTTYVGATERLALDRLVRDFGAEVKIQYDALRTRLHAKAWLFRRRTGFDTAYVGSSNLSRSALLDGVEWNVRLSRVATPALLEKFSGTFDTYWNDTTFECYDPEQDADRLDDALAEASGRKSSGRLTISLAGLEVRPFPFQAEMLEQLAAEREVHDRHRNLIVAATGTGKTVLAALDYRDLCSAARDRPSLLFVAHRKEILEQSLRTYQEVLTDANFGELYVGGTRPDRWRHVFASVQSLTSYGVTNIATDHFDIVVIDEFHHAEAATYRAILRHLVPRELLGLTATPERADGVDVRQFFDGRTAAELRLWDALGADLLCPFHYFGLADGTDLQTIEWKRGAYDVAGLSSLYTGNDARARLVIKQLRDKVADIAAMRCLGFCVSVAHAEYMARVFNEAGIPALAVTGVTPVPQRDKAIADLRKRRANVLFTADLFNEGLDIPEVDTVLFLRPTESATIFLQQLGRGLRRAPGKAVLTALDFVGHHRREFRFDVRYRALTGESRRGLERQIHRGFPFLPSGCQILLDEQARRAVLDNIRNQIANRWPQIVSELRSYGDMNLRSFLAESGLDLSDIVRANRSWTQLRRVAGLPTRAGGEHEARLLKRVRALTHVDDADRAHAYQHLIEDEPPRYDDLDATAQRYARMLFFSLWPDAGGFDHYADGFAALRHEPATRDELRAVIELSTDAARHVTTPLSTPLNEVPLRVHARYQREEILAALDYASVERRPSAFQSGVLYSQHWKTDAFLITLIKSEADYSPTTMYRDYPISRDLFHWESQSTTSAASETGQRYVRHMQQGSSILLFVRQHKTDEFGTSPYLFLGSARYVQHTGERPIAVTWKLHTPMPADFFAEATVAAS